MAQFPWGDLQIGPGGLENRFLVRGIYLNDRSTEDRYHVDRVEGIYDFPKVRTIESPLPARDGISSDDLYYGGRTITFSGRVVAGNVAKLRAMEQSLKHALFSDQTETAVKFTNATGASLLPIDYNLWARPVDCSFAEVIRSDGVSSQFRIVLQASDPRIYGATVRERSITFSANATVSDPIWNFPNYGNWYARANVRLQEAGNATSWSVTNPRVFLAQSLGSAIGVMYSGSATGAAGTYREIQGGSFFVSATNHGAGYVGIVDQASAEWGSQSLVNQGVLYSLVIPPLNFDPNRSGRGASINAFCTAKTNTAIAKVRWVDTYL